MTIVKYKGKEIIDQSVSREFNPEIQDSAMFSFKVKILLDKDDIEKVYDDTVFDIEDSDARVKNWFRNLYMRDQDLHIRTPKLINNNNPNECKHQNTERLKVKGVEGWYLCNDCKCPVKKG